MRILKELLKPGEVIVVFTTTEGFHNYHCIMEKSGEDRISALNHTLETMLSAGYDSFEIKAILCAAKGETKGSTVLLLDHGYVIPGEIFTWNQTVVTYESVANEKTVFLASSKKNQAILLPFQKNMQKRSWSKKQK